MPEEAIDDWTPPRQWRDIGSRDSDVLDGLEELDDLQIDGTPDDDGRDIDETFSD